MKIGYYCNDCGVMLDLEQYSEHDSSHSFTKFYWNWASEIVGVELVKK